MKNFTHRLPLITFLFIAVFPLKAQLSADFTMSVQAGCAPISVEFTADTAGVTSWFWYLGPHQGTSSLPSPSANYTSPGNYQIKLVVSNGTISDSVTKQLVVYARPVANFTGQQKGCAPLTVSYTDQSVKGSADIVSWKWDFRTGDTVTLQNPIMNYNNPGKYDAFLMVTDANGCSGYKDAPGFVDVVAPPVARFSFTPTYACVVPATFSFNSNDSEGAGNLTYAWNFGDNTTSSENNPSKTYNQFDSYKVNLEVTTDYGCSHSVENTVNASLVVAGGTLMQNSRVLQPKDTICAGALNYSNSSTGSDFIRWSFGTLGTSVVGSGDFNILLTGPIKVTLIAAPGTPCADTVTWDLFVETISADFAQSTDFSCNASQMVNFTNLSVNATKWEWTFQDGQIVNTQNSSKEYRVPYSADPYKINQPVTFVTFLAVESKYGCKSTTSKILTIHQPTALFFVDKSSGCVPLQVKFKDQSISVDPIDSREWIFGNGDASTTDTDSTAHGYITDGSFNARLVITNNLGCKDTSYNIVIRAGKTLLPDFTISKTDVCPHEQITFTNTTPESGLIQGWRYLVDEIPVNKETTVASPAWRVRPDFGPMDVKLEVVYNGCVSTVNKPAALNNKGPVSAFSYAFDCATPLAYSFNSSQSAGHTSFKWLFSGQREEVVNPNPLHSFASEGDSLVWLITYNAECSDTFRSVVPVRQVNANIDAPAEICADQDYYFKGNGSYSIVNYCYEKYLWDFGTGFPLFRINADSIMVNLSDRGNKPINLYVKYDNGCVDSAQVTTRVYKPFVSFAADTTLGCTPFVVEFTDNSLPDDHSLESWHWQFEPGIDTISGSIIPVIAHEFKTPGEYGVSLTLTDNFSCKATQVTNIFTANPNATFTLSQEKSCLGDNLSFTFLPQGIDSLRWDFGNGVNSNDTTWPLAYKYPLQGNYEPSLTLYRFGCTDTWQMESGRVEVQKASAYFDLSDSLWNCYPHQIILTHQKEDQVVNSGQWDFNYGNSFSPYVQTRVFNYPKPGIYKPSLHIQTSYGCRDTFSRNITLSGPVGSFTMTTDQICRNEEVTFALKDTADVLWFSWDMGDGTFLDGNPVSYKFPNTGTLYPRLVLYSDSGKCRVDIVDTLTVYMVEASFEVPDSGMCATKAIVFKNSSQGNEVNNWNFSHGIVSTLPEPTLIFLTGQYTAQLIISNSVGCSDTAEHSFTIHQLPILTHSPDTIVCSGASVRLWASGGNTIQWSPATGLTDPFSFSPLASPSLSTNYTITILDTLSKCGASSDLLLLVQSKPVIDVSPALADIIIGERVRVVTDSLGELTYTWSPDYMISCLNCATPWLQPLERTLYTLTVSDTNQCFTELFYVDIDVRESYTVELPKAFTPGRDNENSVLHIRGHGIKRLIEFRIYNRWGNEVFFTDDLEQGWDGTLNGRRLNVDTYVYMVTAEMWNGETETRKGTVTLLR